MKLKGSKKAQIQCVECQEVSSPFRVWLYEEDEIPMFDLKDDSIPEGWEVEDEGELDGDLICGYCPKHKEVS